MPNNNIEVKQGKVLDKNIHVEVLGNQVTNQKKKRQQEAENDEPMRDGDGLRE